MYLYIVTWTYTTFRTILYHPAVLYVNVTLVTCTHQTECKVLCELLLCRFRVLSGQAGSQPSSVARLVTQQNSNPSLLHLLLTCALSLHLRHCWHTDRHGCGQ